MTNLPERVYFDIDNGTYINHPAQRNADLAWKDHHYYSFMITSCPIKAMTFDIAERGGVFELVCNPSLSRQKFKTLE